ncbi:MAG: ThiF family adenylyltransferase [Candidatus Methanofastidiosia archaeon]
MEEVVKIGVLDEDRYERSKRLGIFDLKAIKRAKLLVVGAGAIGNEVLKNLVLSGYRKIDIVDMDYIVKSNLNRCLFFGDLEADEKRLKAEVVAEKLKEMAPKLKVGYHTERIEDFKEDFISKFHIVLGGLDNIPTRLHINSHAYFYKIPYIDGGTLGLDGGMQVIVPPKTSCYECRLNKTHMKILNMIWCCTGRETTLFQPKLAAEITTTAVIGALQAREALKLTSMKMIVKDLRKKRKVSKKRAEEIFFKELSLAGKLFYYNGLRCVSEVYNIPISKNCPNHESSEV